MVYNDDVILIEQTVGENCSGVPAQPEGVARRGGWVGGASSCNPIYL